jgi:hypothetical protein
VIRTFGADEAGGPILVGIMPHTTRAEVDSLIAGLQKLIHSGTPTTSATTSASGATTPTPGNPSGSGPGALAHAQ